MREALSALPKVDRLAAALGAAPERARVAAARDAVGAARERILAGGPPGDVLADAVARLAVLDRGRIRRVLNATGVVVHTNLGRAPWSPGARAAALAAMGACDVELDRASGARGGRLAGASAQLRHLVGAEAALVVNNCAAAVLLALTALAHGREVVVSRGQLVEIGGSFRVPEVIASGGARLVEVGTTNRTRAADYAQAIGPATAVLLAVHPSNFRQVGFVESVPRAALAAIARERGVLAIEDLGSGDLAEVRDGLAAGLDLVAFSGDKLLGGPQAGVVVGRAAVVERLARHPLYRALRVDKVTLAALEATLGDHLAGRAVPVAEALGLAEAALRARAEALATAVGGRVTALAGQVGGGAHPGEELPSWGVALDGPDPDGLARALRLGEPAVLARVARGAVVLDPRAVPEDDLAILARAVAAALAGRKGT